MINNRKYLCIHLLFLMAITFTHNIVFNVSKQNYLKNVHDSSLKCIRFTAYYTNLYVTFWHICDKSNNIDCIYDYKTWTFKKFLFFYNLSIRKNYYKSLLLYHCVRCSMYSLLLLDCLTNKIVFVINNIFFM